MTTVVLAPLIMDSRYLNANATELKALMEAYLNQIAQQLMQALQQQMSITLVPATLATSIPIKMNLAPREQEVLQLMAKGLTQKEIGRVLTISPTTVAGYKKELYRKLTVSNAAEAIMEGLKLGLITS